MTICIILQSKAKFTQIELLVLVQPLFCIGSQWRKPPKQVHGMCHDKTGITIGGYLVSYQKMGQTKFQRWVLGSFTLQYPSLPCFHFKISFCQEFCKIINYFMYFVSLLECYREPATLPNLSPLKLEFQVEYQTQLGIPS